jgi:predicted RNA-binding protein with PIN domain
MPVLIDGNNLLFAARTAEPERPPSRATLCRRLSEWAQRTGEKVTVVFDGPAPSRPLARQISAVGVSVGYSGSGVSADDRIAEAIQADSAPRRLLVISSDRAVARAGRRRRARTMRSDVFWAAVQRAVARPKPQPLEPPEKRRGLPAGETKRWLRELGLDGDQPDAESERS